MVQKTLATRTTSSRVLSALLFLYYLLEGFVLQFIPYSWRQKNVSGQTVLITGGGSGIGQLMVVKFVKLGCKVVVWDVAEDGMAKTIQMVKNERLDFSKVVTYKIDLCDREAIYATAKRVKEEIGPVDILINNAGVVSGQHLLDIPDHKIDFTFKVNVLAHFWVLKAFLPDMIKRKSGHIVTIASVAGNVGSCVLTDYCASKFANVGFDYSLRLELAQAGLDKVIKTSIVKPYFITTGMFSGVNPGIFPFLKPEYVAQGIVNGILAEEQEIVLPHYFSHLFWLMLSFPTKCFIPITDFVGGFEFMSNFHGRANELPKSNAELNNNAPNQKDFNDNNNNNNNNFVASKQS